MQGELIIETDLKTDKFDRKLEKLEAKYKSEKIDLDLKSNNIEDLKFELKDAERVYVELSKKIKDTNTELEETTKKMKDLLAADDTGVMYGVLTNKRADLASKLAELEPAFERQNNKVNKLYDNLTKAERSYDKQKEKIKDITQEIQLTNIEIEKNKINEMNSRFDGVKANIREIGKGIEKNIKKISRWALAIFGIRGAYMAVRNAINVISQDDAQLKADIDYMKKAFAYVLEPVARKVVELAKEIMLIIGYILKSVSGGKIDIFAKADKHLASANKSAKELSKTLAGFDEMNVLNDNSGSGTEGGLPSPSVNSEDFIAYEAKINGAINDLIDKWFALGKEMENALSNPEMFERAYGVWAKFFEGIVETFHGLWQTITGIVEMIGGILDILVGIFTGDFEKIKEGFNFLISGIVRTVIGLNEIIAGIGKILLGIVTGLLSEIWSGIKGLINWVLETFMFVIDSIIAVLKGLVNLLYDYVISPIGDEFSKAWDSLKQGASDTWEGIKSIFSNVASFFGDIFGDAWETVKNIFSTGGRIFMGITEGILNAFKAIVNAIIDGINNVVAIPFQGINTALNAIRALDLWGWKPFEWLGLINVPRIPKLAKGGIVNNPSKGIPIGGAIAGESGREGVLPLDDAAVLSEIADAIGSRITINANIINTMNGRIISRELQKIKADNDFAYNR